MKIMWITFAPVGKMAQILYGTPTQSGGWVDATLDALLPYIRGGHLSLQIATLDPKAACVTDEETGVLYRTVNVARNRGKRGAREDQAKFKALIDDFSPDVIQIWGTEFTFGLDVIAAAGDIPVCFYIQGVMSSLVMHPLGDISPMSLFRQLGASSFFKLRSMKKLNKLNAKHLPYEAEMIEKSAGLIVDNDWTCAQYRHCTNKFYFVPLATNSCFEQASWSTESIDRHTLFTVAGGNCPQKGVHDAVLAVAHLKEKYPDIKLYIPGNISKRKPRFLYNSIFIRHINKLIEQYHLQANVSFTGRLSAMEMAQQMKKSNAFVMPSCVETHSSSLREAMLVGAPCVSTDVGSVPEFLHHGKNGFLYRYGESETLAYYLDKIFSSDSLAQSIGASARQTVNEMFPQNKIGEMTMAAYEQMISGGKTNG